MSKIRINVTFRDELTSGQVESRMARMRAIIGEHAEGFMWEQQPKIEERDGRQYFVQEGVSARYGSCRLQYDPEGTLVYETGDDMEPDYQGRLEIDLGQIVARRSAEDTSVASEDTVSSGGGSNDYDAAKDANQQAELYRPIPGVVSVGFLNERVEEGILFFRTVHVDGMHLSGEPSRLDFCADELHRLLGLNFPKRSYGEYGEHQATSVGGSGEKCSLWLTDTRCDISFGAEQHIPEDKRNDYLGKIETALVGAPKDFELVE